MAEAGWRRASLETRRTSALQRSRSSRMLATFSRRQRGTSLIELMAVVGIVITLSAFAIMNTLRPTTTSRANNAVDAVVSTLIQGRQLAVSKRRNVLVSFNGTNPIQLTVQT